MLEKEKNQFSKSLPYHNYTDVEMKLHPLFLSSAGDMKRITKETGRVCPGSA